MLVNCSDLKKPPTKSSRRIKPCGVIGVNIAGTPMKMALTSALITSTCLKPKRRRIGAAVVFMAMAPTAVENVSMPDWNGRQAEAELEQERQQKGRGADADAVDEAAHDACKERIDLEQAEIEERRDRDAGVTDIEPAADEADNEQRRHDRRRKETLADGGEAEGETGEPDAGQDEALDVERRQTPPRGNSGCSRWQG